MTATPEPRSTSKPPAAGARGSGSTPAARRALRRKLVAVAVVIGVSAGVVVTRALWAGTRALAQGDAAYAEGDVPAAIERWRRAARWYVPGGSHVDLAYDRLETEARAAEARGDRDLALSAWRGVRSSILATRGLYLPHEHRLEPANRRIAALMAAQEQAAAGEGAARGDPAEAEDWHYQRLAPVPGPSPFWSLFALLGLATWLGGGILFALRGVTDEDRLVPRTAGYAGILVAVGLVFWLLGLHLA
ncbi:hypothetical protein [Haliangium sp.]|uniref:hypothetical protein n=1 Tax=Haliangium sp. TaxID=2663208 RepID=UPI003D0FAE8D